MGKATEPSRVMRDLATADRVIQTILWCYALGPTSLLVLAEVYKERLIYGVRFYNWVDFLVLTPVWLCIFYGIHAQVFRPRFVHLRCLGAQVGGLSPRSAERRANAAGELAERESRFMANFGMSRSAFLSLCCIGVFSTGHGMHFSADAVNTMATEIHPWRDRIPDEVYHVIYLMDETLGHLFTFTPFILLVGLWTVCYPAYPKGHRPPSWNIVRFARSFLLGIGQAVAMIEGDAPWLNVVCSVYLLFCSRAGANNASPLALHAVASALGMSLGLAGWGMLFGLSQPSAYPGGIICRLSEVFTPRYCPHL